MSEHDDKVFKQLADAYVEQLGALLLDEQEALRQQNLSSATPRADRLIGSLVQDSQDTTAGTGSRPAAPGWGAKRGKILPFATAAAAACLVLFVGAFALLTNLNNGALLWPDNAANSTPSTSAPNTSAPNASAPNASASDAAQDSWLELHPLDFNLPRQFTIAKTDWDNGQSVYTLDNTPHDDVVLTIQRHEPQSDWFTPMDSVVIDGRQVPAIIKDEYKLLRFADEGTLYTLSCRDDLGTLAHLYRSIVDPQNKVT
jgi:hypothetical protein